ncbi:response regulator transcription factor [Pontiella sulfatireligans]|uniref:Transcriptional activator protein CzcR n=1 Tax=Pontiella sulfatireligans TaxID=2750658 RepID=A0A6C2USZ0_9BACT|nr:response regulator transcription factor [Pontiella sulfatireligans]VGO23388.1 Transcriptional activator protein CzcR [Pontiella sulfatireligans]
MKVLVVEDEEKIASFVHKGLETQGFSVTVADNGDDGFAQAASQAYDVVLLDIMLPGRDGLSILKELREQQHSVPVILLTARSEANERVGGLNLGADDYVTKPFFMDELLARINAVARRTSVLHAGPLTLNLISREARYGDEEIIFAPREFSLLEHLMRTPGNVFTRTQLLEQVWGYGFDPQTNLVDVCIRRIREKIDRDGRQFIETVRGVGYRFNKAET